MSNQIRKSICTLEFTKYTEKINNDKIKSFSVQLQVCKSSIQTLKKEDTSLLSKQELFHLNKRMDLLLRKKKLLSKKLSDLGYITDRRGRPKKNDSEKYKSNHIRMACYFTPKNIKHMKVLKEQGRIDNISSFLNELISYYFSVYKDGVTND